jgi:lipopolysaccharide/colanic/teichoic acid biosynthesis glycosyltransferase
LKALNQGNDVAAATAAQRDRRPRQRRRAPTAGHAGHDGLWQVSGRSDLSREESVLPDLRYVENWTIALDAEILVRTVHAMVRGDGAY